MGGRGRSSGRSLQITLDYEMDKQEIKEIICYAKEKATSGGGGYESPTLCKKCACCGSYTIPVDTEKEICIICGWIDDEYQNTHPQSINGYNPICLEEYRKQYFSQFEDN